MFNYDPSKFSDRVAARKLGEDLAKGAKNGESDGEGALGFKGSLWLIIILLGIISVFGK